TEMLEALKKAKEDLKKPQPPQPGQPGQPGEEAKKPLIEYLAELKMLRSLQLRINKRTEDYSKENPGEQTDQIKHELEELGDSQKQVQKKTTDLDKIQQDRNR